MLRIAINCELAPGTQAGGTQSVVSGLVRALGQLDGPEKYSLITHPENRTWLEPLVGPNTTLHDRPQPNVVPWKRNLQRAFSRTVRRIASEAAPAWPQVPRSDGFYESLGASVIHWPWQHFVVTAIPSIFNPHDLLHLHYPQFFQPREITAREAIYPIACRIARTVVVASEWTRDDIGARYGVSRDRLQIIPWAAPTAAAELAPDAVSAVRVKFQLPQDFAFFPAVTWEHKNHLRLLAAIAAVRDRGGPRVMLICTGHRFERHAAKVEAEVSRLALGDQVRFLGSVTFAELRAIYRAAQFVIIPTLFEAASGPMFESWNEGIPVACSTVTSLPQQAADAALLFDPYSVQSIADALEKMSTDSGLREKLKINGERRLADFPWDRTARAYRAVYRQAAGARLEKEDAELLDWDWMKDRR
jgi:glycosyltransferase involved in cell wall biosynthesis